VQGGITPGDIVVTKHVDKPTHLVPTEPEPVGDETIEDLELGDADEVGGGLSPAPPPGGPVPIPYPNVRP